jgi:hypothetical protein
MKLAIIADLHLGSKDIGDGRWKQRAFQEIVIAELRREQVSHIIFAGDTLDFKGSSTLSADKPNMLQFAVDQLSTTSAPSFLLMGNHDDMESCQFFEYMGGPRIVKDDWVSLGDSIGAYLMGPRQDRVQARSALDRLDTSAFSSRILVLHEDLQVFQDQDFLSVACDKFQLVVNGHNHVFRPVKKGAYLLPACLPWKARMGSQCDLTLSIGVDGTLTEDCTDPLPWGFLVVSQDLSVRFVPIDCGTKIILCKVEGNKSEIEASLRNTLDKLMTKENHNGMVVQVYLSMRLDKELELTLHASYADHFLDLRFSVFQGAGAIARKVRERLPTEQAALESVQTQHGDWARQMVEQLSPFFQLRSPRNRKEDIFEIIEKYVPKA